MDKNQKVLDESKLVKLMSVEGDTDAEFNISLLKSTGIEVIKRFKGSGSYLNITQGRNYQGIDLYVLESDLQEARSIIEAEVIIDEDTYPENVSLGDDDLGLKDEVMSNSKTKAARGMLWLMGGLMIIVIIAGYIANR